MEISGVVSAVIIGTVAALIGSAVAAGFDVRSTKGADWIEWLIPVGPAANGIAALDSNRRPHRR
ncbi:hypothetical protein GA0115240_15354 [Streptomyces sp. DvalAA-14]|uniref:hypothetical protein n=1 Tax=unclassified Streptomyces TaxID=2593676 RepID=UPI00081B3171|nr:MULTISPECIES: hypothetical protein [unclassified Streptomyces]MYS23522.1 hypothetical protein [Streptomyces sp. SID4948]SCE34720.1 hypothetical protein GA0115240_15354 [Streptomyces sp. DvalAA-14]